MVLAAALYRLAGLSQKHRRVVQNEVKRVVQLGEQPKGTATRKTRARVLGGGFSMLSIFDTAGGVAHLPELHNVHLTAVYKSF